MSCVELGSADTAPAAKMSGATPDGNATLATSTADNPPSIAAMISNSVEEASNMVECS